MSNIFKLSTYLKGIWEHAGFQRYFANTGWLFAGKAFSLVLSFFLFSYVARYLGPANLGNLSYAQSFVSLLAIFASFGIDGILYRDLVKHKERRQELLGSALFMKLVLGFATLLLTLVAAFLSESEPLMIVLIGIIALTNIFQPFTLPSFYFDAVQRSKINTIGAILVNILLALVKIGIIVFDKGIIFFAAVFVLEAVLNGIYYVTLYSYNYEFVSKWQVRLSVIKELMRESLPLMLASISAVIYARIDQIMLKHFLDAAAVGLYSVAVRIAEIWNFVPGVVIFSLFPAIVNAKLWSEHMYQTRFRRLLFGSTLIAVFFALFVTIFAKPLILIIGGVEYVTASQALIIYVWGVVGMVITSALQQLLIAESWTKITFYITLAGALANIILNIWFIPKFGLNGAAFATLIAYWAVPLSLFLFKDIRQKIISILLAKTQP